MQLSAVSFAPNLLQNKPVGAQTSLASAQLAPSQADSFTPSAKIRQGNVEEAFGSARKALTATTRAAKAILPEVIEKLLPKAETDEAGVRLITEEEFYKQLMCRDDERFYKRQA